MPGAQPPAAAAADTDTNRHLDDVCTTLGNRLQQGIERVLACVAAAEDREQLASTALSLLQHQLTGSLHLRKVSPLDADMRLLSSRAPPIATSSASARPSQTHSEQQDYIQLLQAPRVRQALDSTQSHLLLEVSGIVAPHSFTAGEGALQLRLDIYLQCGACIAWEAAWQAGTGGDRIALVARTPWDGVLRSTVVSQGDLRVDVEVLSENDRRQRIGYVSLLTPATLMQQHAARMRSSPTPSSSSSEQPEWPKVHESFLAISDDSRGTSPAFKSGGHLCNVEARVKQLAGATRLDVSAPSLLELAGYVSAAQESVADGVKLRLLRSTPKNLATLERWYDALHREITTFRSAAGEHCGDGFDPQAVRRLMALQITLDEAAGHCAEELHPP